MWDNEAGRLQLLNDMQLELNVITPPPPQPPKPPVPRYHRKSYGSIRIGPDGRIEPIHKPQRLKAETVPVPRRKVPPPPQAPQPSKLALSIARYLEKPAPQRAIVDRVPEPEKRTCRSVKIKPPAKAERSRAEEPLDALDIKALAWLRAKGIR